VMACMIVIILVFFWWGTICAMVQSLPAYNGLDDADGLSLKLHCMIA